jgi:hypothetical protein
VEPARPSGVRQLCAAVDTAGDDELISALSVCEMRFADATRYDGPAASASVVSRPGGGSAAPYSSCQFHHSYGGVRG